MNTGKTTKITSKNKLQKLIQEIADLISKQIKKELIDKYTCFHIETNIHLIPKNDKIK